MLISSSESIFLYIFHNLLFANTYLICIPINISMIMMYPHIHQFESNQSHVWAISQSIDWSDSSLFVLLSVVFRLSGCILCFLCVPFRIAPIRNLVISTRSYPYQLAARGISSPGQYWAGKVEQQFNLFRVYVSVWLKGFVIFSSNYVEPVMVNDAQASRVCTLKRSLSGNYPWLVYERGARPTNDMKLSWSVLHDTPWRIGWLLVKGNYRMSPT